MRRLVLIDLSLLVDLASLSGLIQRSPLGSYFAAWLFFQLVFALCSFGIFPYSKQPIPLLPQNNRKVMVFPEHIFLATKPSC
mmetsp:Transcript_21128/g.34743  ORF Transcript_21128/g.34743 Transcript_21128/m.34743 type:complete len:82 (-) Transcript_21128:404-649(-)